MAVRPEKAQTPVYGTDTPDTSPTSRSSKVEADTILSEGSPGSGQHLICLTTRLFEATFRYLRFYLTARLQFP